MLACSGLLTWLRRYIGSLHFIKENIVLNILSLVDLAMNNPVLLASTMEMGMHKELIKLLQKPQISAGVKQFALSALANVLD